MVTLSFNLAPGASLGAAVAYIAGYMLLQTGAQSWKWILASPAIFAVIGLLARGHSASGVVAQRGAGAPPHVFVTGSPAAPAAMLFVLVLAATLCAAAGWAYSRVADRARRRLSS